MSRRQKKMPTPKTTVKPQAAAAQKAPPRGTRARPRTVQITAETDLPLSLPEERVTVAATGPGVVVSPSTRHKVNPRLVVENLRVVPVVVRPLETEPAAPPPPPPGSPEAKTLPLPLPPPPPVEPPPPLDTVGPTDDDGDMFDPGPPRAAHPPSKPPSTPPSDPANSEPVRVKLREVRYDESVNVRKVLLVDVARRLRKRVEAGETIPEDDADAKHLRTECSDLLGSVPALGLIEPPTVSPDDVLKDGGWVLVAGFRRVAVLWYLYGGEADVLCVVKRWTRAQRRAANLAENAARKQVTTWAAAQRCYELKHEDGMTIKEIAEQTGYSLSHTENLVRVRTKLSPKLWKLWQEWEHAVTLEALLKLCPLPHEEQERRWEEKMAGGGRVSSSRPRSRPSSQPPPSDGDEEAGDEGSTVRREIVKPVATREELEGWLLALKEASARAELGSTLEAWIMGAALVLRCALKEDGYQFGLPNQASMPRGFRDLPMPGSPKRTARAVAKVAGRAGA